MRPSPLLRRFRAAWMDSSCTITRPTGTVWDDDIDDYVDATTEIYSGACHVRPMQTESRVVQAGERAVSLRSYFVEVPSSALVDIDDTVTVDSSPDGSAVGMTLRVLDVPKNELVTVRVVECEEQV